ncbi:rho GTPase-activating protein [Linnemannia zychae]|nr:rho GTPase-activating protein [Linnemannia zychae]
MSPNAKRKSQFLPLTNATTVTSIATAATPTTIASGTKSSASPTNVQKPMASPSEIISRGNTSHEAVQKSTTQSNNTSSGGGLNNNSGNTNQTKGYSSSNSSSSGGVSAFSYLRQKLFGPSSSDLPTTTASTTGASKDPAPSSSTNSRSGSHFHEKLPTSIENSSSFPSLSTTNAMTSLVDSIPLSPSSITTLQQQQSNSSQPHRFFSRTLPNRRQAQPQPPLDQTQIALGPPIRTISNIDPVSPSSTMTRRTSSIASPTTVTVVSPARSREHSQNSSQPRRRPSAVSQSNLNKHLSTGSMIYQEGYLNKKVDLHSGEGGHGWKVYKVLLKSSKLYFYRPGPTDDRPKFQDAKDHQRHQMSLARGLQDDTYSSFHSQSFSLGSGGASSRLSITNECGMILSAFKFESSTRTLLFEGNAKPLGQGTLVFAPPVARYIYGESFTEIDRATMQFKKHVALLLFEDSVMICKRKWIRSTAAKVKDAIKFNSNTHENNDRQEPSTGKRQPSVSGISYKSGDSRGSEGEPKPRSSFDRPTDKQRGYFTKWKHEATYPLAQVEALDMASPVPSASATFYPFAAPAASTALANVNRNPRDSDISSIYRPSSAPSNNYQTTSTLELVITSVIDNKEYTERLLFLPPSQEVRHRWYSKFNRAKELYQQHSKATASKGRVASVESLHSKDAGPSRSSHSNPSTLSLHSPTSPKSYSDTGDFTLETWRLNRSKEFNSTTLHPELTFNLDEDTGEEILAGASIDGLIHEIVFNNTARTDLSLVLAFASTFPLYTTSFRVLKELERCINLLDITEKTEIVVEMTKRIEILIQEMVSRFNIHSESKNSLDQIRVFTMTVLQGRLQSEAVSSILSKIDILLQDFSLTSTSVLERPRQESSTQSTRSGGESTVDLSHVLITGLTPALFLKMEPTYFSEQVLRYHNEQLQRAGGIASILNNPAYFQRQYPTIKAKQHFQNSLIFSMNSSHFLTVLITHHILIATQSVQSTSRRPKLLAQWIRTGCCSRSLGDMAGFIAIAIGLCSAGIVRLQETWKQVPFELRKEVVDEWMPLLIKLTLVPEELRDQAISSFDLESSLNTVIDLSAQNVATVVPCLSNIKQSIDQLDASAPSFIQSSPVPHLNVDKLERIHLIMQTAKSSYSHDIPLSSPVYSFPTNGHLQQYFAHLAHISQTLYDQYQFNELSSDAFESSLACEPHINGQYLDYHYKNRKMTSSFIPLMFPEIILTRRLFPIQQLLSLEHTGNTNRKSSFDEAESSPTTPTFPRGANPPRQPSGDRAPGTIEWTDSAATLHGPTTTYGADEAGVYPQVRKRTYSFPPARVASRNSAYFGNRQMINMINPHLDAVAREAINRVEEQNRTIATAAMRNVTGIDYNMISIEGGHLILKVRDESLEDVLKATKLEEQDLLSPPSVLKNQQAIAIGSLAGSNHRGSNRSSLLLSGTRTALVKAGSLETLIYIAVMGLDDQSGKYTDEKGDMVPWNSRPLVLDRDAFTAAFFATYRSFCTTTRLLDQLMTLFMLSHEPTKRRESNIPSGLDLFPGSNIDLPNGLPGANSSDIDMDLFDWKRILTMQRRVLNILDYWLVAHFSDFLDDLQLKTRLADSLRRLAVQEKSQRVLIDASHGADVRALEEAMRSVQQRVIQQSMKPPDESYLGWDTIETFLKIPPSIEPTMDDSWTSEQLLRQLNTAATAHFLSIRHQEWFVLFEVLESQSADPLGWYLPRLGSSPTDDEIFITGIHNTLYSIRRNGALGTHWNGERLINSLPMCLQSLCKLHHVIRCWVMAQISAPGITFDVRVGRIRKMLDVILQSRNQMIQFSQNPKIITADRRSGTSTSVGIPSFVEASISSALVSPECRAYTRAWLEVAAGQRGELETFEDILAVRRRQDTSASSENNATPTDELVPEVGWLIERMLETCCYVRDMSYESPHLINFDKRQYIYDLVKIFTRRQEQLKNIPRISTPLASWLGMSSGPGSVPSLKAIREAAQKEFHQLRNGSTGQLAASSGSGYSNSGSNKAIKVFSKLITMQQEKYKRDQKEFERLDKQIKETQGRIQKAQQEQAKTLEKQIKLEQGRSRVKNQLLKSTLMRAMRPISLAITNSWSQATTTVSNATALGSAISGKVMGGVNSHQDMLDITGKVGSSGGLDPHYSAYNSQSRIALTTGGAQGQKPALVISLVNSSCSVAYTYTKRDHVFKIVTEEGGQFLLQALDYDDMLQWIKTMNDAAAEATAKRRTLLDNDESLKQALETAAQEDELPAPIENERKGRNSVFGVELRHLMSHGEIPLIVEKCITEIEKRGLEEVGIYRVPGAVSAINRLRLSFNTDSQNVDLESDEWKDINVVAGALKQFLRELPEAVMTNALYDSLIAASALEDYDERLLTMKDLIRSLPPPNYILLKRIIEHLERVTDFEEINHMYATNLAIVFGPTLLRPGGSSANSFATSMKNLGHQQNIVRNMILQYHWLFDVEDEEGAADQDAEETEGVDTGGNFAGGVDADGTGGVEDDEEEEEEHEFPEILEDSDEDEYEEEEEVYVLSAAPPLPASTATTVPHTITTTMTISGGPLKENNNRAMKDQRRKTIIFG